MEQRAANRRLNDIEAHAQAMTLSIDDVVHELVELLGTTTVALIGGVGETRAVHEWTKQRQPQRPHVLRFALQIASMIDAASGDHHVVRAWFQGSNPLLDDAVPALLLRNEPLTKVQAKLAFAARAFAAR